MNLNNNSLSNWRLLLSSKERENVAKKIESFLSQAQNGNNAAWRQLSLRMEEEAFNHAVSREAYLLKISEMCASIRQRQAVAMANVKKSMTSGSPATSLPSAPKPSVAIPPKPTSSTPQQVTLHHTPQGTPQAMVKPVAIPSVPSKSSTLSSSATTSSNSTVTSTSGKNYSIDMINGRRVINISGSSPLPLIDLNEEEIGMLKSKLDELKPIIESSSKLLKDAVTFVKKGMAADQTANLQRILRIRTLLNLQIEVVKEGLFFLSVSTLDKMKTQLETVVKAVHDAFEKKIKELNLQTGDTRSGDTNAEQPISDDLLIDQLVGANKDQIWNSYFTQKRVVKHQLTEWNI